MRITRQKRSQMESFESVIVLIIFFILIGLGLIFYAGFQKASLKQIYGERTEQEAIKIAMRVSYLPEILCSKRKIIEDDCFDVYKLDSLSSEIMGDETIFLYYQSDFKDSVISIRQIFPPGKSYVLYKNQPEDAVLKNFYIIPTYVPVSLKNSSMQKEYSMGLLNVTMFVPKV